jgi:c-di-GMP-binding flagellar brake protein YcgR
MEKEGEAITGGLLLSTLRDLVHSRKICRMEIPHTEYGWFTVLLDVAGEGSRASLWIDRVSGFDQALAQSKGREVSIEFLEKGAIPCWFQSRVLKSDKAGIEVRVPEVLYRVQRRHFFRMKAPLGSEAVFYLGPGKEKRGSVKDYSLGGVALFLDPAGAPPLGEQVTDLRLRVLGAKGGLEVSVPLATVRRISHDPSGRVLCAIEFLKMAETARESLWRHLLEEQRASIQRFGEV